MLSKAHKARLFFQMEQRWGSVPHAGCPLALGLLGAVGGGRKQQGQLPWHWDLRLSGPQGRLGKTGYCLTSPHSRVVLQFKTQRLSGMPKVTQPAAVTGRGKKDIRRCRRARRSSPAVSFSSGRE